MGKVQDRAHAAAERMAIKQASTVQASIFVMKRMIKNTIPSSFQWWVSIDENEVKVEYVWRGHPNALPRECSDGDFSIVWLLLSDMDWQQEIQATIDEISAREAQLLETAQSNRKRRLLAGEIDQANAPLMLAEGAGGGSPPDRPATGAHAHGTGRGSLSPRHGNTRPFARPEP